MSTAPASTVPADRTALSSDIEWLSMRTPHEKIVTIHVGQGSLTATFTVHADFLTNCSSFFRSSFNGQLAEAKTSTMTYPETTPSAFGLFLDWAYRHQLTLRNTSINLTDYVDLWLLADKLNIPGLQASAIAAIDRYATRERPPGAGLREDLGPNYGRISVEGNTVGEYCASYAGTATK